MDRNAFEIQVSGDKSSYKLPEIAQKELEPKEIDQALHEIANKVFNHERLSSAESQLLHKLQGSGKKITPASQLEKKLVKLAEKSDQVCQGKYKFGRFDEKTHHLFDRNHFETAQSQSLAAKFLQHYQIASSATPELSELQQQAWTGKPPPLTQIEKRLGQHNAQFPPCPEKAGTLCAQIGDYKIVFGVDGKLTIAPADKILSEEIAVNKTLTPTQSTHLAEIHDRLANNTPYGNAGPFLDFMKHFAECKKSNPDISIQEAFTLFNPQPDKLYDKYQNGDCVVVAAKIREEAATIGVKAAVIGILTENQWANPPTVFPFVSMGFGALVWDAYAEATENITHCQTVVHYNSAAPKEQRVQSLDALFAEPASIVDTKLKEWKQELNLQSQKNTLRNIVNIDQIIKSQMTGKSKLVLTSKGSTSDKDSILGVDFFRGNLYLNSAATQNCPGLPLNEKGRFSLTLEALRNADDVQTFYVNNAPTQMTNREALELLYKQAGPELHLPDDFVDNMLALAANEEALLKDILLPDIRVVRHLLADPEIAAAGSEVTATLEALKQSYNTLTAVATTLQTKEGQDTITSQEALNTFGESYRKLEKDFDALQKIWQELEDKLQKSPIDKPVNDELKADVFSLRQKAGSLRSELSTLQQEIKGHPLLK